jgi:hypothetical protein
MVTRFKKLSIVFGSTLLLSSFFSASLFDARVLAAEEGSICEDDLTTTRGLRWGGKNLPLKKVVDIRECLVGTQLGRVTADRHGSNTNKVQLNEIFAGPQPYPGERNFISLWGSKIEGCFVEMIVQYAPPNGTVEATTIVPTTLQLGLGSQLIELPLQTSVQPKLFQQDYVYSGTNSFGNSQDFSSTWYMSRTSFVIDSQILELLRSAPTGEVRARLTFVDNETQLLKISPETVKSWNAAFGFNPTCQSPEAANQKAALGTKPLLGTLQSYSGSAQQKKALEWLQSQVPAPTLAEFGKRWRNDAGKNTTPIRLLDAFQYYQKTNVQTNALAWLETQLSAEVLNTYLQQWS